MTIRGIRGATTVAHNSKDDILKETKTLINQMIEANQVHIDDIASIFFQSPKTLTLSSPP